MIIKEFVFVLCVLEGRVGGGAGGGGWGLLHMNINLDSTSIIITGHVFAAWFKI